MSGSSRPNLELENAAREAHSVSLIAGLDEAGRGAIAGPVVAAAVILPPNDGKVLRHFGGVNDSKQLNARKRESLEKTIKAHSLAWAVGQTAAEVIDQIGILPANARAMTAAVAGLATRPEFLLLDGRMRLPNLPIRQLSVIRGDSLSLSVAAASILAKVARDRLMIAYEEDYPGYGFARHKGYCTVAHAKALKRLGPCQIHRRSFAPLRRTLV